MPLRDHFHSPLADQRPWESIHTMWLASIAEALNAIVPAGYFAAPEVHAGSSVEIDVGTFEEDLNGSSFDPHNGNGLNGIQNGGTAVADESAVKTYSPPAPEFSFPLTFCDDFEVRVFRNSGGWKLVAAIELVSPANKDRAETVRAFATKCASYLQVGVAVIVIDVVTSHTACLHDEIMAAVTKDSFTSIGDGEIYAVAYRPIRKADQDLAEAWPHVLSVGSALPVLPLWLNAVLAVPVDLEATYTTALQRSRIT